MPNEEQQFLEEVVNEGKDVMEASLVSTQSTEPEGDKEEQDDETPKNRYQRRLKERLHAERESNIAMAAKLDALSEAIKGQPTSEKDYLKSIDRIYGTDSPEALAATQLLKQAFVSVRDEAKQMAIEEIREERRKEAEEIKKQEQHLDSMIEEIEDTTGSSLSGEQRKGFFRMLERMSPKDSSGNILHYADPMATWEIYQEKLSSKKESRAKDLSARSMVQGSSRAAPVQDDAMKRALREAGII